MPDLKPSTFKVPEVTYQRPVKASLMVHIHDAEGTTFEATQADLEAFGYRPRHFHHSVLRKQILDALTTAGLVPGDFTVARLNPVREFSGQISYGGVDEDGDPVMLSQDTLAKIVEIEGCLQRYLDKYLAEEAHTESQEYHQP